MSTYPPIVVTIVASDTAGNNTNGQGSSLTLTSAVNHPPTASAIIDNAAEDATYSTNLLTAALATDADQGDVLSVVNPAGTITTSGGRTLAVNTDYTVNLVTGAF